MAKFQDSFSSDWNDLLNAIGVMDRIAQHYLPKKFATEWKK
jgi:hypothetical protein